MSYCQDPKILNNPSEVHQQLNKIAERLDADELILVMNIADHALRRSYELVAEVFGLEGVASLATQHA